MNPFHTGSGQPVKLQAGDRIQYDFRSNCLWFSRPSNPVGETQLLIDKDDKYFLLLRNRSDFFHIARIISATHGLRARYRGDPTPDGDTPIIEFFA